MLLNDLGKALATKITDTDNLKITQSEATEEVLSNNTIQKSNLTNLGEREIQVATATVAQLSKNKLQSQQQQTPTLHRVVTLLINI